MLAPREKVSFEIGFDDSVRLDRSEMMGEGIPKRRMMLLETTRDKSNVDTRLGEKIEG